MEVSDYDTGTGLRIRRKCQTLTKDFPVAKLVRQLDDEPGCLFSSNYEYPGRYTQWNRAVIDPPLVFEAHDRWFRFIARRRRAEPFLDVLRNTLSNAPELCNLISDDDKYIVEGNLVESKAVFDEEYRTKQPSIISLLRLVAHAVRRDDDDYIGFYGAFGYDLIFQLEPDLRRGERNADGRDIVLYIPDHLMVEEGGQRLEITYEFFYGESPADTESQEDYEPARYSDTSETSHGDQVPSSPDPVLYHEHVRKAKQAFERGDLFEVVLSQTFSSRIEAPPSKVFERLQSRNPSPYSFSINLGEGEFLVGASPEMFVRSDGDVVETCPISGTIGRGEDPVEDAENIRSLLNSEKDEAELTMCTDVDRNDKARVCIPGTVQVLARRQIELYSRLIHTVDHVRGSLREECDAWDAFLTHLWAVTVTGAPKREAVQFIEDNECEPRQWYGGAIGYITFSGHIDTGLTLRSVRMLSGRAEVRAGATLLLDSDPASEEAETQLKASAMMDAISRPDDDNVRIPQQLGIVGQQSEDERKPRVLLVDHEDSFVNNLADYFRQAGCHVTTRRWNQLPTVKEGDFELAVLSPGPGIPSRFNLHETIENMITAKTPIFGACLGLQGIVEYFGGHLEYHSSPVHGRASTVKVLDPVSNLFSGLPNTFSAGRYHSLHAKVHGLPTTLAPLAQTDNGILMAVRHLDLPIAGVQFHPESLLTLPGQCGPRIIENVVREIDQTRGEVPYDSMGRKDIGGQRPNWQTATTGLER